MEFRHRWTEFDAVYVHGSTVLASRIARYRPTILRLPGPVSAELAPRSKRSLIVCANGDALTKTRTFLGDHARELPIGLDGERLQTRSLLDSATLGVDSEGLGHWICRDGSLTSKALIFWRTRFAKYGRAMPQARLLVIGSGEEQGKLRMWLNGESRKELRISNPTCRMTLLPEWYRAMDLFVMPSRYENYSNAALEALACGMPFLASGVGGNQSLAETPKADGFSRMVPEIPWRRACRPSSAIE